MLVADFVSHRLHIVIGAVNGWRFGDGGEYLFDKKFEVVDFPDFVSFHDTSENHHIKVILKQFNSDVGSIPVVSGKPPFFRNSLAKWMMWCLFFWG